MKDKIKDAQRLISDAQGGKANIKGKEYTTVPLRVEVFRSNLEKDDLNTTANVFTYQKIYENRVISKTYLAKNIDIHLNQDGKEIVTMESVMAVGTAEELRDSSMINKTSAVENAETSSVGRMLANLGLHGGSYASHEEVKNAIDAQDTLKKNENVVELKTNNPITQNDVTQHQDRSKDAIAFLKDFQSKWQKTIKTSSDINDWLIEHEYQFEDLRNNDLHNYEKLRNRIQEYRNQLNKGKSDHDRRI